MADNPFRAIPSVAELASQLGETSPLRGPALTAFLQSFVDQQRQAIASGARPDRESIVSAARTALEKLDRPRLEAVVNATGVVIHTNLGRAPVSVATAQAMSEAASSYVSLELDPESNERGGRMSEITALMRALTGAEATLVVNNNAAAVMLVLASLAFEKSVIVSRGEAVEIGGGFRIPDVMRQSGARLVEVGTTNRTYPRDYESAVDDSIALFLKVHASNFTIEGFTATTTVSQLADVSLRTGVPIVEDLGSGALIDTSRFGLQREPTIGESIASGAAVITASGDKLLGGPQAGIIAGKADLIAKIERHPLARAFRADKTCLAGVAATLRHYALGDALERIPVWRVIAATVESLRERGADLQRRLASAGVAAELVTTHSTVGGGSLPGQRQPSIALGLGVAAADDLARSLRSGEPRVFGRIDGGMLLLDLRTVLPEDDDRLVAAVVRAASAFGSR